MKWIKKGLIFKTEDNYDWMLTHSQVPLVDKISDDVLRIYFGTRDKHNQTVTTFIEVEADNPQKILYVHNKPVIELGNLGCFDDSGVMPSWIVDDNGKKYLYYTGWNVGLTVPYRNSIGIAVQQEDGTFKRFFEGPIVDRTFKEPHFCGQPCVIKENNLWRMWYLSCVKWEIIGNKPEPFYHTKYAESIDGKIWNRKGIVSIDFKDNDEAGIVRPSVINEKGLYKMWYSYRGVKNYRTDKKHSYKIGYAESKDGVDWIRKDEIAGIDVSETGWDSVMIAYPFVYEHNGTKYMFYNGNGFGKSGFGYAVLDA